MSEWIDPYSLPASSEQRRLHVDRYAWAASSLQSRSLAANAACSNNYGSDILKSAGIPSYGYDRCAKAIAEAHAAGRKNCEVRDIEDAGLDFSGFGSLVCLETIEHLKEPAAFTGKISADVREMVLSTPIIPTKHLNEFHLHDFTEAEIRSLVESSGWNIRKASYQDENGNRTYILIYAVR